MIKEIKADQLRIGMCVCGIDKPSSNSTYRYNTFFIRDQKELEYLLGLSDRFYIDTEQGDDVATPCSSPEKDFAYYFQAYSAFLPRLSVLYGSLRQQRSLDFNSAKVLTEDLMKLVIDNPTVMVACCWERLDRQASDELSRKSLNVAIFCLALAWQLGLSTIETFNLGLGALLHDIGITQVPEAILNKQGPLTSEERSVLEQHVIYGLKLLATLDAVPADVKKIVYHHHERFDGQGYPGKLKGEGIDLAARLVSMISVFEALTRDRVYSQSLTPEHAIEFLHASGDTLFDQRLIEHFTRVLGIYPEGSIVELSTGHLAVVAEVNPSDRFTPKLKYLTDEHKNLLDEQTMVGAEPFVASEGQILKLLIKDEPVLPFLHVCWEQWT